MDSSSTTTSSPFDTSTISKDSNLDDIIVHFLAIALITLSLLCHFPIETSELRIAGPRSLCTLVIRLRRIATFSVQSSCYHHCAISLSRAYLTYLSHILLGSSIKHCGKS
jgi:hypothetical protein